MSDRRLLKRIDLHQELDDVLAGDDADQPSLRIEDGNQSQTRRALQSKKRDAGLSLRLEAKGAPLAGT
jgi:hypothetical protein